MFFIDTKNKPERLNLSSSSADKSGILMSSTGNKSLTLLWGATGEQEWTPALTTGLHILHYDIYIYIYILCNYWQIIFYNISK